MLVFTACKKETLLETKQDLNPTNLKTKSSVSNTTLAQQQETPAVQKASNAVLDEADSISFDRQLTKSYRIQQNNNADCFGPTTGICGSPTIYSSCYYKYQIWNDPNSLYVDLYFPSSIIGTQRDCYGKTCQYYVTPCIVLDLYNANGSKIGSINVANSDITVSETRVTYNLNSLKSQYPGLACVKLNGFFYVMKKCKSYSSQCGVYISTQRVSTVCISQKQFCLQQCPSTCPTVSSIKIDNTTFCQAGNINGIATISGDVSKVVTTWTTSSGTYTGNNVTIPVELNTTCSPITKTITVTSICTTDQSVLKQTTFNVTVNPIVTSSVQLDNFNCNANIQFSCEGVENIQWTIGSTSGTGNNIPLISIPQTINYTYSAYGCNYVGSTVEGATCFPLFQQNHNNTSDK